MIVVMLGLMLALAGGLLGSTSNDPAGAQNRRVVVVGDSILLGAKDQLTERFVGSGWHATMDMAVSRSTSAGLTAIESHRAELTDSLVISLGANDSGNTDAFRAKVIKVLDAVAGVPHVYWLTIAEVRPYYRPANQVLRDAASLHPNLTLIDWASFRMAHPAVTGSDGLHLTPLGAQEMANLVTFATVTGNKAARVAVTTIPSTPASSLPKVTATTVTTSAGGEPAAADVPAPSTSEVGEQEASPAELPDSSDSEASASSDKGRSEHSIPGVSVGIGFASLLIALVVAGVSLGTWSLVVIRKRRNKT